MPRLFINCQCLFTGLEDEVRVNQTLLVEAGQFSFVGPQNEAPARQSGDELIDAGSHFVMPGLIDVHTHLVFGDARSEEDVDLWVTPEFRALRRLFFAQHVLAAGYTSIVAPCRGQTQHHPIHNPHRTPGVHHEFPRHPPRRHRT